MTDLMINLPTINSEWVEKHFSELLSDGTEFFYSVDPISMEFSVGCLGYAEEFKKLSDLEHEKFHLSDEVYDAEHDSKDHIESIFKDHRLWNKMIVTKNEIESYNDALREIIFQIADNYANAMARYMGLETYETQKDGTND